MLTYRSLLVFVRAILAGIMIGTGGSAMLAVNTPIIGPFMFSIGLMVIIQFGLKLYTGMVGYFMDLVSLKVLAVTFIGNFVGVFVVAESARYSCLPISDYAYQLVQTKADMIMNLHMIDIFAMGCMCGMLMYIGVAVWKQPMASDIAKCFVTIMCVMTFIVCGFEHCIADMFYLLAARTNDIPIGNQVAFIGIVTLGNSLGAMMFHCGHKMKLFKEIARNI